MATYLDLLPGPIGDEIFDIVRKGQRARMAPAHEELSTRLGVWRKTLDEHATLRIGLGETMRTPLTHDCPPFFWNLEAFSVRYELLPFSFATANETVTIYGCEYVHFEMWVRDPTGHMSQLDGTYATPRE